MKTQKSWLLFGVRSALQALLLIALTNAAISCKDAAVPWTTVGPEGGLVEGPDGVTLTVPAGALDEDTELRIRRVGSSTEGVVSFSPAYAFEPIGQTFNLPVQKSIPYDAEAAGDATQIWMWTSLAENTRWTPLFGDLDLGAHTVSASTLELSLALVGTFDASCVPECEGRDCGPDGCGGDCLPGCAGASPLCDALVGQCYCVPSCEGRECGPDGCGGTCAPGCDTGECLVGNGQCTVCGDGVCDFAENAANCSDDCASTNLVDVLFVVDNTNGNAAAQLRLSEAFYGLMAALDATPLGIPNLHIGVVTTDLGSGTTLVGACDDLGGDAGALHTAGATELETTPYLVDERPAGCEIDRDPTGRCVSHTCGSANCTDGVLVNDARSGCPRCRNHTDPIESMFNDIAAMGVGGCEFIQPLEAMRLALDAHADNPGFLRSGSVLAVVIVSDEDDCSVADNQIFDATETAIDSPLGPLTDFRCFEFGVSCDTGDRTEIGTWDNCAPSTDASTLLHPIDRYSDFLYGLRDPGRLVIGAVTGPVAGSSVTVGTDPGGNPELELSCFIPSQILARPAIRLRAFVTEVTPPGEPAFGSVCDPSYFSQLSAIGDRIRIALQ